MHESGSPAEFHAKNHIPLFKKKQMHYMYGKQTKKKRKKEKQITEQELCLRGCTEPFTIKDPQQQSSGWELSGPLLYQHTQGPERSSKASWSARGKARTPAGCGQVTSYSIPFCKSECYKNILHSQLKALMWFTENLRGEECPNLNRQWHIARVGKLFL